MKLIEYKEQRGLFAPDSINLTYLYSSALPNDVRVCLWAVAKIDKNLQHEDNQWPVTL